MYVSEQRIREEVMVWQLDTSYMNSRARTKTFDEAHDSVWSLKTIVFLVAIVGCLSLVALGFYKLKMSQVASLPAEFEGQIVEKWAGFNESEQGSSPYFRVVVEVDGSRLSVPVYKEIYEEAQVGMRLKRSAKGLEVIRGPAGRTEVR